MSEPDEIIEMQIDPEILDVQPPKYDRVEHPHPDWYNAFPPKVKRLKNGKWEARAGDRYVMFASPVGSYVDQFHTRWFARRAARRLAKRLYREQQRESESRWEMA